MKMNGIKNGLAGLLTAGAMLLPGKSDAQYKTISSDDMYPKIDLHLPKDYKFNKSQTEKKKTDWLYHGLEASFVGLNVADYVLTMDALKKGIAMEGNPLAKGIVKNPYLAAACKAGTTASLLYLLRKEKKNGDPALAEAFLFGANLVLAGTVANNILVSMPLNNAGKNKKRFPGR